VFSNHEQTIRVALSLVLITAFSLGMISTILRQQKVLGFAAVTVVLIATLMGGSRATAKHELTSDIYLGLDFFLLNLIFLGMLFIPIERLFKRVDQPILRYEWREDLLYFFISTLFVQALTIPALWKFHAVHHSAQAMDWLAGSRMHVIEVILMRSFTTLPMYVMGFAEGPLYAYVFFVYLLSVFIHANIRIPFGFLQYIVATPRFHHWHHGIEEEAIDKNFAIHFPVIDMVFGTFHMPGNRWPEGYGIGGHPVPKGFWNQLRYPFRRDKD